MIDVALVGCGRISKRHVEAISATRGIRINMVCDIDKVRAHALAGPLGVSYSTDMQMIHEADVIVVATPSGHHPKHVISIAENCSVKYILCEKPLSLTVREAIEMYNFTEKKGKCLLPIYQNRYNPIIQYMKQFLTNRRLGTIYQVIVNVLWNRDDEYYKIGWHGTRDLDGGVLYTQASHYVDMLLYLFGPISEAKGFGTHRRGWEVDDSVSATIRFGEGAVASLNATVSVYEKNFLTEMTIIGEEGTVRLSGTNLNEVDFWNVEGMKKPDIDFKQDHIYGKGHDAVYKYIVDENWKMFPAKQEVIDGISLMEKLSF